MTRNKTISFLIMVCFILYFLFNEFISPAAHSEKKAVVLPISLLILSLESLIVDHLGCYGYPYETSPNIDYYSRHSVLFSRAFSPTLSTDSSLMTLLTSLYPTVLRGILANSDISNPALKNQMLQEILHQKNYKTSAFVGDYDWIKKDIFQQGFDRFDIVDPFNTSHTNSAVNQRISPWIEQGLRSTNPIFTLLMTNNLKVPCFPPVPYNKLYAEINTDFLLKKIYNNEDLASPPPDKKTASVWKMIQELKKPSIGHDFLKQQYDGQLRFIDSSFGHLIRSLPEEEVFKELMILITANHGALLQEPTTIRNSSYLHDEYIRIPLILRLPNNTMHGLIKESITEMSDIKPTLLELLGFKTGRIMQGKPLFQSEHFESVDEFAYSEIVLPHFNQISIRTHQWKYIIDHTNNNEQLYHLVTDPAEQNNLAYQDRYLAIKQQFIKMLEEKVKQDKEIQDHINVKQKVDETIINRQD